MSSCGLTTGLIDSAIKSRNDSVASGMTDWELEWIICHVLGVSKTQLRLLDREFTQAEQEQIDQLVQRRMKGEPLAYVLGEWEFYGLPLKVTRDTLIPRPETEGLVEHAISLMPKDKEIVIADLGTGSGAIILALASNFPCAKCYAVDQSAPALDVAQANAQDLNINNIEFRKGSWFDPLKNLKFDLIMSNPPYIEENDPHLNDISLQFEPKTALASGCDGLNDIRIIVKQASSFLNENGCLLIEHGYNQQDKVVGIFEDNEFIRIERLFDLAGKPRGVVGRIL